MLNVRQLDIALTTVCRKSNGKTCLGRTLLVLDDEPQIGQVMQRCLKNYSDKILYAETPVSAYKILEKNEITHLLSDLELGDAESGMDFVVFWRREFTCIERVVIFSGHLDVSKMKAPPEVDALVSKNSGIESIIAALSGEEEER